MSMTIAESDVQQSPGADWSLANGVYAKTVDASTDNTVEEGAGVARQLVMSHEVNSGGCDDVEVDGITVCKKIGHAITFKCSYPMKNQDLTNEADFKVSGSDTEKTATGTGKLTYKLTVDETTFAIGSTVTATITPVTSGLVHATIESCSVTHKGNNQSVKLIDDGMQRECALGVDVTTAQGTGNLSFNWSSFKWSTALNSGKSSPDEDQEVSCNISLSKAQPTTEAQNDCAASSGAGMFDNSRGLIELTLPPTLNILALCASFLSIYMQKVFCIAQLT